MPGWRLGSRARRHGSVAALSVAATLLGACNLLTGLDADYQLKSGASTEGGTEEGGGPDGSSPDSSKNDAPAPDASDASTRFCDHYEAGIDLLCTDFEDGMGANGAPAGWLPVNDTVDGGSITVIADPKRGRVLDVTSPNASASRQTRVYQRLTTGKASELYLAYEVDFDFRLVESTLDYDAFGLLVFEAQVKSREHGVAGYRAGTDHELSRQAVVGNAPPSLKFTNDMEWHHARIRLTHSDAGAPFYRKIQIDTPVGAQNLDDVPGPHVTASGSPTELWLGVFNTSANTGRAHIQFDNVVFRRIP